MRKIYLLSVALICALATGARGPISVPAELSISDSFPGTILHSDSKGVYVDWALSGGNPCVTAEVFGNGEFFADMDLNSGLPTGVDCDTTILSSQVRYYTLTLASSLCNTLNPLPPGSTTTSGGCIVALGAGANENPRIVTSNPFSPGASTAGVTFAFNLNGKSWQLNTDSSATVTPASGSISGCSGATMQIMYGGSATLKEVAPRIVTIASVSTAPFQFTACQQ